MDKEKLLANAAEVFSNIMNETENFSFRALYQDHQYCHKLWFVNNPITLKWKRVVVSKPSRIYYYRQIFIGTVLVGDENNGMDNEALVVTLEQLAEHGEDFVQKLDGLTVSTS
ncbi:MAG: hypothetical protein ACPGO5_00045 [Patescibacteria group bacterium]